MNIIIKLLLYVCIIYLLCLIVNVDSTEIPTPVISMNFLQLKSHHMIKGQPICKSGLCPLQNGHCCSDGKSCCLTKCVKSKNSQMVCSDGVKTLSDKVEVNFHHTLKHDTMTSIQQALNKVNMLAAKEVKKVTNSQSTPSNSLQPQNNNNNINNNNIKNTTTAVADNNNGKSQAPVAKNSKKKDSQPKSTTTNNNSNKQPTTVTNNKIPTGSKTTQAPLTSLPSNDASIISRLESMTGANCDAKLGGLVKQDTEQGQPRLDTKLTQNYIQAVGKLPGMTLKILGKQDGAPVYWIHMKSTDPNAKKNIFISSGVHGDEPIGVTSNLELMAKLYKSDLRKYYSFTFVPMVNPGGLRDNMRTNREGVDMNRLFVGGSFPKHLVKMETHIRRNKYDLSMDLHGAKRRTGFFVIRATEDQGLSTAALSVIDPNLRLRTDSGQFPGYVALGDDTKKYHLNRPGEAISDNPGTLKGFLNSLGTPNAYTMEYPGSLPVCTRQSGLVSLVISMVTQHHIRHP